MATRRYRIESMLGRGSYGAVYRATLLGSEGFEKPVAIKVVESAIDDAEERLIDEARLLGRLRHRAIPAVDSLVFLDGDMRALVLEYVDGAEIGAIVKHAGRMPPGPLAELGAELASALAFAWQVEGPTGPLHMVHRDVKTSNVMLTQAGDVKLLDFGIARGHMDRAARTQTGMIVGTARYMAPEAFAANPGPEADVFALAITLLKLRLSVRNEPLGLLRGPRFHSARASLIEKAELSRPWQTLLHRMLEPDPAARPDAVEVGQQLEQLASDLGGPGLRTWARQAWKRLPRDERPRDDPNIGRVLTELGTTRTPVPQKRSRSAWLGLGAGLGVSLVSVVAVAAVLVFVLVAAVGWWWWSAPVPGVRLVPIALTSDANPEQGIAIDAAGHVFYVDEGRLVRSGDPPEVLPFEHVELVSTNAAADRLALVIDGEIVLARPDGSGRQPIGPGSVPQLSPSGDRLVYRAPDGLRLRDLSTGTESRLSAERAHARWSPDGVTLGIPEPDGLVLLDVASGERSLVGHRAVDVAFTDERIWIRSLQGAVDALSWVPRSDPWARPVQVLTSSSRLEELVAAPRGPLAWTQAAIDHDLMLHEVQAGGLGPAVPVPVAGRSLAKGAQVSDAGAVVGSVRVPGEGTGTARLELIDPGGQRIDLAQVAATSGVKTLADRRVVFWDTSATDAGYLGGESAFGGMHLVEIGPNGRTSVLMPLSDGVVRDWVLDPSGRTIAVLTEQGEVRIGPVGTNLLQSEQRIPAVEALFGISASGVLALRTAEGLGVWEEGTLRTVLPPDQGTVAAAAWLDDRKLLAHTDDRLLRLDVPSGGYRTWSTFETVSRQRREVAVSPDGKWVLIDHSRVHGDVWIAEILPE